MTVNANAANAPKISVVIPMYNALRLLPPCMDSLLAQTMPDFEIVAVDDGSTDGTNAYVAALAGRDKRVRLVAHEKNSNILPALLTGFDHMKGDFLFCSDADDVIPPDAFRMLLDRAERTGADAVHGRTVFLDGTDEGKDVCWAEPFRAATGRDFVLAMLRNRRGWNVWGKLFRARAVRAALPLFPRGKPWYDLSDLFTCCLFGLRSEGYAALDEPVYLYRMPPRPHFLKAGGYAKWADDSLSVLSRLDEIAAAEPDAPALRARLADFARDCIAVLFEKTASNSEGRTQVLEKMRTLAPPEHLRWAEERGYMEFGRDVKTGTLERLLGVLRRAVARGPREMRIRRRTKDLYARWERKYEEDRRREAAKQ